MEPAAMTDANYDDQLNEPDPPYCDEHGWPLPCVDCACIEADRAYDSQRDRKDDHDGQ
jgi:hypothetical protein